MNDREPSLGSVPEYTPLPRVSGPLRSVADLLGNKYTPAMQEAFPDVAPPYAPFGYLALLQLRKPRKKIGSIHIPESEHDVERYRVQAALVRSLGPQCFCDRQTGAPWREGIWYEPGDFIRSPMFGGDRFNVDHKVVTMEGQDKKTTTEQVTFVFIKEADALALVTGDPLNITTS